MDNLMIRIDGLVHRYHLENGSTEETLRGIDLRIRRGEFVSIIGHNGSGKSTLLKHLNGTLTPTGGAVFIDGIDTADEDRVFDVRQTVGMVFQNPDNQIVATIVEEDVAFAPENLGLPAEEIRRRVDEALAAVRMTEYKNHAPHRLSGGQKQRIAIAGILAMRPACIALDEPTAMLDPAGRREVLDTVMRLNQEEAITIVMVTHNMEEAALADRVLVMDRGLLILDGPPKQVFSEVCRLRAAGLAVPQTVELLSALRDEGCALPIDALSVEECTAALAAFLSEGAPPDVN